MPRKPAFTLIELLVVISIIGILMAIMLPSLHRVREQARETSCRSNLKNIGVTVLLYLQDNDFRMPDFHTHTNNCNGHLWRTPAGRLLRADEDRSYWGVLYYDYVKEEELFGCPSFKNFSQIVAQDMLYDGGDIENAAYSMNGWLSKEKVTAMRRQAEVVVAHDHMEPRIENSNDMLFAENGENLAHYREGGGRSQYYRGIFRHAIRKAGDYETGGRLNCLWLDGHVTSIQETLGLDIPKRYYDPLGKN